MKERPTTTKHKQKQKGKVKTRGKEQKEKKIHLMNETKMLKNTSTGTCDSTETDPFFI